MQLDSQQSRAIVLIADTGSISSAARALGVGQAALTRRLEMIEAACGFRLFERDERGVRVTEAGRVAVRHARALCQPRRGAPEPECRPEVRLACSPGVLDQLLPDLAHHLAGTVWSASIGSDAELLRGLQHRRYDLALLVRWPHVAYLPREGLVRRKLCEGPLRVLVPAGRSSAAPVRLAELGNRPWVLRTDADARTAVLRECTRAGIQPDVRFHVDEPATVAALAARGEATAVEPLLHPAAGLTAVPYQNAAPFRLELVHLRGRRFAPAGFADLLDAVAYAVTSGRARSAAS